MYMRFREGGNGPKIKNLRRLEKVLQTFVQSSLDDDS